MLRRSIIEDVARRLDVAEKTSERIRPPAAEYPEMLTYGAANMWRYFERGCSFVAAGVDVLLLTRALDELAKAARAATAGKAG